MACSKWCPHNGAAEGREEEEAIRRKEGRQEGIAEEVIAEKDIAEEVRPKAGVAEEGFPSLFEAGRFVSAKAWPYIVCVVW